MKGSTDIAGPDVPGWPPEFASRYRAAGYWTGQTIGQMLAESAARYPDRTAIVDGVRRWTYRELDERANQFAAGLSEVGIEHGDAVVVQLPNIAEFFETIFALVRLGAVPLLALPAHRSAEISYFCQAASAKAYVIADRHGEFDYVALAERVSANASGLGTVIVCGQPGPFTALDRLRREPDREHPGPVASDLALLQLSGGSTAVPKLIPRTHDDYLYSVRESARICELGPHSVYLAALPVAHNFTLSSPGSLGVLYAGGTVVLTRIAPPEVAFELIEAERVTITAAVPPLALAWSRATESTRRDLSSLRVLQVGGAKLTEEAARLVSGAFDARLQQVYGMAEGLVNYTRLDDPEDIVIGTQGRPISPDDELRVVDERDRAVSPGATGHLQTRGPYTIRGYYRAAEHNATAFTPDGFYRTGDLARVTADGYLVVEGRHKDQINRGGEKIAAEEVENHLLAHAAVHDAAVVSIPDPYLGERSCAFVVPRRPQYPEPARLKVFLRDRGLAEYKIPDRIEVVDRFPYTPVGKVSKAALRRAITDALRAQSSQQKDS